MTEHWQVLISAITIMAIFVGLSMWAVKFIVSRAIAGQRDQYRDQLEDAAKKCSELTTHITQLQVIERQVLELKATLPLDYVRKEDFIRHEVVINAKLDRIFDKLQGGNPCK